MISRRCHYDLPIISIHTSSTLISVNVGRHSSEVVTSSQHVHDIVDFMKGYKSKRHGNSCRPRVGPTKSVLPPYERPVRPGYRLECKWAWRWTDDRRWTKTGECKWRSWTWVWMSSTSPRKPKFNDVTNNRSANNVETVMRNCSSSNCIERLFKGDIDYLGKTIKDDPSNSAASYLLFHRRSHKTIDRKAFQLCLFSHDMEQFGKHTPRRCAILWVELVGWTRGGNRMANVAYLPPISRCTYWASALALQT